MKDKMKKLTTGWASRTFQTGRMAASLGGAAMKKVVNTALERDGGTMDESAALAAAEQLVARMDNLKGLTMKMGQMVSYLDGSMPENAQRVLRKLQRGSKPLDEEVVRACVERELGGSLGSLFDTFDLDPFAAASIGQVHRATRGDEVLAVKVQYPDIARTLEIDLGNLKRFAVFGTVGTAMSSNEMVEELRARMAEECDYLQEAGFQGAFAALLDGRDDAGVPAVVADRCAEKILTTQFVEGVGFYEFAEGASQAERDAVGRIIFDVTFHTIFRHSMFNGDPHPGNYLLHPGEERVTFLDYGCVKVFDADFVTRWKRLALSVMDGRRRDFPDALVGVGFVDAGDRKFDYDYQWRVMHYLYKPFLERGFRYDNEYVKQSYDLMLWKNPNKLRTAMPSNWLLLNRLQWGLNSVLAHLKSQANWGEIIRGHFESPTIEGVRPARLVVSSDV